MAVQTKQRAARTGNERVRRLLRQPQNCLGPPHAAVYVFVCCIVRCADDETCGRVCGVAALTEGLAGRKGDVVEEVGAEDAHVAWVLPVEPPSKLVDLRAREAALACACR